MNSEMEKLKKEQCEINQHIMGCAECGFCENKPHNHPEQGGEKGGEDVGG